MPTAFAYQALTATGTIDRVRFHRRGAVISTSYERTSVIVTTNLPFERWTEVLGNERLVAATLDRPTHRCHLLEATGESYRLREATRRRQGRTAQKGGARQDKCY